MNEKPIVVMLDVDGVLNFLGDWEIPLTKRVLNGYPIRWPDYMPDLVASLVENCEVHWLTTWRHEANRWILPALGIEGELPVLTDGTTDRYVDWKHAVARMAMPRFEGREVYWIEDFGHDPEPIRGITFVDTVHEVDSLWSWKAGLTPNLLPPAIIRALDL